MATMPAVAMAAAMPAVAGTTVAGPTMAIRRGGGDGDAGHHQSGGSDCQQAHSLLLGYGGMFPVRNERYAVKVRLATGDGAAPAV